MTNFHHTKKSAKQFDETVDILREEIEKNSFAVLCVHDVQATLAGKGITHTPYKIVEFCRAPAAKKVLDADPLIGLFLPCKAIVFKENNAVTVSVMKPTLIASFFPDSDILEFSRNIEHEIVKIIDACVS